MAQLSLFVDSLDCPETITVPGLCCLPDFIDAETEAALLATIDQ